MTECYYFTMLMAANGFADQSNSLHTSFYFTARCTLYCSASAVAEGDRKSFAFLSQRNSKQTPEKSGRKSMFPQSYTELASLKM